LRINNGDDEVGAEVNALRLGVDFLKEQRVKYIVGRVTSFIDTVQSSMSANSLDPDSFYQVRHVNGEKAQALVMLRGWKPDFESAYRELVYPTPTLTWIEGCAFLGSFLNMGATNLLVLKEVISLTQCKVDLDFHREVAMSYGGMVDTMVGRCLEARAAAGQEPKPEVCYNLCRHYGGNGYLAAWNQQEEAIRALWNPDWRPAEIEDNTYCQRN
jgi:hypothetical protein